MKLAILLATYNGAEYLEEQLQSLFRQSCSNFTCYVHDDGSSDDTVAILKRYEGEYPGRMVLWDYPSTGSAKQNFWSMLQRADADYIMFCDQDDVWKEEKVALTLQEMQRLESESKGPAMVFSDMEVVDRELNRISDSFIAYVGRDPKRVRFHQLISQNVAAGCTCMINRELRAKALLCPDPDKIRMHDWWLMLVASVYGRIGYIDQPLVLYRQHGDNSSGAEKDGTLAVLLQRIRANLFHGMIRKTKERILGHREQAALLDGYDDLPEEYRELTSFLANADRYSKIARIRMYRKYRIFRNNRRNWWTLLWV